MDKKDDVENSCAHAAWSGYRINPAAPRRVETVHLYNLQLQNWAKRLYLLYIAPRGLKCGILVVLRIWQVSRFPSPHTWTGLAIVMRILDPIALTVNTRAIFAKAGMQYN